MERELLNIGDPGRYAVVKQENYLGSDSSIWTDDFLEHGQMNIREDDESLNSYIYVMAVGKEEYERFVQKLGGKVEDYEKGAILVDDVLYYNQDDKKYHEINALNIKPNETLKLKSTFTEETISIKILERTKERILGMPNHREFNEGPVLIVSDDYFKELTKETPATSFEIIMKTKDVDNIAKQLDKLKENNSYIGYNNIHEEIKQQRALVLVVSIFLYGFITVITLIGVTNIFNTITTNMALRSREFAMLKAIGMTNKEFNRMIRLESLLYGLKSLIIGIPIGVLLSYAIHRALGRVLETSFTLPWGAILISILFVFLIVYMTMRYSLKKINKQNIIETIREENI